MQEIQFADGFSSLYVKYKSFNEYCLVILVTTLSRRCQVHQAGQNSSALHRGRQSSAISADLTFSVLRDVFES